MNLTLVTGHFRRYITEETHKSSSQACVPGNSTLLLDDDEELTTFRYSDDERCTLSLNDDIIYSSTENKSLGLQPISS